MSVTPAATNPKVRELVRRLDEAMTPPDDAGRCRAVKRVLEDTFAQGTDFLEQRFLEPNPARYARRLVHKDPQDRYTVLAMVWNGGQGTPLHDHAGIWCVEGVVEGRMDVTQYDLVREEQGEDAGVAAYRFEEKGCVHAAVGSAGCLIPPFEYHILANALDEPSITLHVYGGEMTSCHIFEPLADGRYIRRERPLGYHE